MKIMHHTNAQLHAQAELLRERIADLEAADVERQHAQTTLQESETGYRRLFETARDGSSFSMPIPGKLPTSIPGLMKMLGYSHAELLGQQLWEIGPFQDIAAAQAAFSDLKSKGQIRYEDLPLESQ